MYTIQYRCLYREYWYDQDEVGDYYTAVDVAHRLALNTGRQVRVLDPLNRIVWPL